MQTKQVLATLLGICAVVCYAELGDNDGDDLNWNEFAEILSEIPEKEKYEFVKAHVLRGYTLAQQSIDIEELDAALKLSLAVYNVVKEMSENIEKDKYLLQRNAEICFKPPVGCIDSGDAGIRPT